MNVDELFDEIIKQTEKINIIWKDNNYSSKKVRKDVENNFFHNKNCDFVNKFAFFYALNNRINEKYNNFLKILFRFFSWKKEKKLLAKIKQFLNYPNFANSKLIILQKCENFLKGEDCFESDNNENGLKIQAKKQENIITKKDREIKLEKVNEDVKNLKEEENVEIQKDGKQKEADANIKDKEISIKSKQPIKHIETKKQIGKLNVCENIDNNKLNTREKIEISKEDLLKFNKHSNLVKPLNLKVGEAKVEINLNPNSKNFQMANDGAIESELTCAKDLKNTDADYIYYAQPQNELVNTNIEIKPKDFEKNIDEFNKNITDSRFVKNNLQSYQQQEREMIESEISKISKQDIQIIKDFMQEEINRQMDIAEKNGDVCKMPLSIKEAIEQKGAEKSQVINNNHNNPIINNKNNK